MESGRWVGEESYEMVSFSPAVRNIRLEKEATSGAFRSELFRGEKLSILFPDVYNINNVRVGQSCVHSINKSNAALVSGDVNSHF